MSRDELEYASAQKRRLEAEDENTARLMTVQWRNKKVTEAGGSPELARRRAAADGWDFDKQVEQQYRLHLVQIYYQKRIIPLIQVTAADLRTYYELHKDTEFTTHGQARSSASSRSTPASILAGKTRWQSPRTCENAPRPKILPTWPNPKNSTMSTAYQGSPAGAVGDPNGFVQKRCFQGPGSGRCRLEASARAGV